MNFKVKLCFALLMLAGCAADGVPKDFKGETATLRDSYSNYKDGGWFNTDTAQFFVASRIDGKTVQNALADTAGANYMTGFSMTPVPHERRLPIKTMTIELVGTTHHAADIGMLMNKNYSVHRTVKFTPVPGGQYVVKGKLGDQASAVWIESDDGTVVAQ